MSWTMDTLAANIVMPLSCSCLSKSVNSCVPASCSDIMPAPATSESVRVVFPCTRIPIIKLELIDMGGDRNVPDMLRILHQVRDFFCHVFCHLFSSVFNFGILTLMNNVVAGYSFA